MINKFFFLIFLLLGHLTYGQSYILQEDFEQSSGHSVPVGWSQELINGSVNLDSFYFSDTLYSFPEEISGTYALFDSYNGGKAGGTNSNGLGEEVALVTSSFSSQGLSNLYLSFDYFFLRFSQARIAVDISVQGSAWTQIWTSTTSTVITWKDTLDLSAYTGKSTLRLRWRWINNLTVPNQGLFALDNVAVYSRFTKDILLDAIVEPRAKPCAATGRNFGVKLKNVGLDTADGIIVHTVISGADTKLFSDTLGPLSSGQEYILDQGSVDLSSSGLLLVNSYVEWPADSNPLNDTISVEIQILDTVSTPQITDQARCGTGNVLLLASSGPGELTVWYDSASGGEVIAMTSELTTDVLSSSRNYYASNAVFAQRIVNTHQGPYRFTGNPTGGSYIEVTANQPIVVDSLFQNCANAANNVLIRIYSKQGSYFGFERDQSAWTLVYEDTVNSMGWGKYLGFDIPDLYLETAEVRSFYITVQGAASPSFKNISYSYQSDDISVDANTINSWAFGSFLTDYAWDGKLSYKRLCLSPRVEATASVVPRPAGSALSEGNSFTARFERGTAADPDIAFEGAVLEYAIDKPDNVLWSDYGNKWEISEIKLSSQSSKLIPGTDTALVVSGSSATFTYHIGSGWEDETVLLEIHIKSLETACDTILSRYIYIAPLPVASASAQEVCEQEVVVFQNNSTLSKGRLEYLWYFGDGDSSQAEDAAHLYAKNGNYTVRLVVTSDYGLVDDTSFQLLVKQLPVLDVEIEHACQGDTLHFTNNTSVDSGPLDFLWRFGDGSTSTKQSPSHIYAEAGTYALSMTATSNGCQSDFEEQAYQFHRPEAAFSKQGHCADQRVYLNNQSFIADASQIGAAWYVEQSAPLLTGNSVYYVYDSKGFQTVTMVVSSQFGCKDTASQTFWIDESPKADYSWDIACDQTPTSFTNLTNAPDSGSVAFIWSFGDGETSADFSPQHQFSSTGYTEVELKAAYDNGCRDSAKNYIYVGRQAVADFEFDGSCSGEEIQFVNTSKHTFGSLEFLWLFGDTDSSQHYAPRHTYEVDKYTIFQVTLLAQSGNGCSSQKTKTVEISIQPSCEFTFEQSEVDRQLFTFTPLEKDQMRYTWLFKGDGVSNEVSPVHRFTYPDWEYEVQLEIENEFGCSCLDTTITVNTRWSLGVDDILFEPFEVRPNPADHMVALAAPQRVTETVRLQLVDLQGRIVTERVWNTQMEKELLLDVSELADGIYTVYLYHSSAKLARKLEVYHH